LLTTPNPTPIARVVEPNTNQSIPTHWLATSKLITWSHILTLSATNTPNNNDPKLNFFLLISDAKTINRTVTINTPISNVTLNKLAIAHVNASYGLAPNFDSTISMIPSDISKNPKI
jgi:hypothetical protein